MVSAAELAAPPRILPVRRPASTPPATLSRPFRGERVAIETSTFPLPPQHPQPRARTQFPLDDYQSSSSAFPSEMHAHNSSPSSASSPQSPTPYQTPLTPQSITSRARNEDPISSPRSDSSERPQHKRQLSARSSGVRSAKEQIFVSNPGLHGLDYTPLEARRGDLEMDDSRDATSNNADLEAIEEPDTYANSITFRSQPSVHTNHTNITAASPSRLPDFLGREIFQTVLHNPATAHQLLLFCQSRLCGENMEFLEKVDRYHHLINEVTKIMFEIHRDHIAVNAASQINVAGSLRQSINKNLKHTFNSCLPRMESVFADAQDDIERLVASGIYPRFVRRQMSMSAARALANDRARYAGLGDCFVLTNPSKADNPIVFASDGFVKVTGYARTEIIPRNCRFLQGRHTERSTIKRLKKSIEDRKESVDLLLNYKKNQEPFWNLLYVAPLYDVNGNVVFFLGAQINCSTTIHNASDVIRILSTSGDVEDPSDSEIVPPSTTKESKTSMLFKPFRRVSKRPPTVREAGMEQGLLNEFEKLDMGKQMDAFYTAYSRHLVINYSTFFIAFYSAGIVDMLYPYKPQGETQIVGADVFRFLRYHGPSDAPKSFKDRVKAALRLGQPASLDLMLCTRRYMGFEKFVTHWTPLKDEHGGVEFVILTLGSCRA